METERNGVVLIVSSLTDSMRLVFEFYKSLLVVVAIANFGLLSSQDGDYSKPITEQYVNSNHSYFAESTSSRFNNSNGLCRICNANQELKVRQLALYEPFRERDYDREIEAFRYNTRFAEIGRVKYKLRIHVYSAFRQRLEKSYKLCSVCETTVKNTLKLKSEFLPKIPLHSADDLIRESVDDSVRFILLQYF